MYLEGLHGKLKPIIPADYFISDKGQHWIFKIRGEKGELHVHHSNLFLVYKAKIGRLNCSVVPVPVSDFVAVSDVNKYKWGV